MQSRLDYDKVAPAAMKVMNAMGHYKSNSGREPPLLELVGTRAWPINGCAYSIDMHATGAR